MSSDGKPDLLIYLVQQGGDNLANRKRRNPQVKDLKELAKEVYDNSSPGQPIDEELFQKVYDIAMQQVERPVTLTEWASAFELYLFNHGVTLNSGFDL